MNRVIFTGGVIGGMAFMLLISSVAPAYAPHSTVTAGFETLRKGVVIGTFSTDANCTGRSCGSIVIDVNTGIAKKFMKWCGTDRILLSSSGGRVDGTLCVGNGPWSIQPFVSIDANHLPVIVGGIVR